MAAHIGIVVTVILVPIEGTPFPTFPAPKTCFGKQSHSSDKVILIQSNHHSMVRETSEQQHGPNQKLGNWEEYCSGGYIFPNKVK